MPSRTPPDPRDFVTFIIPVTDPTSPESPSTTAVPVSGEQASDEINLLDLLIVLAKHKRLIIGLPVIVGALAVAYALRLPNIYTATTKILPPQQSQSTAAALVGQLGSLAGAAGSALGVRNPNDLYISMLKSRTIADNLIGRFELGKLYETKTADDARKALEANTRVTSGKDGLINIEFDDKDPTRAAAMANGYVDELYKLTQTLAVTEASQRRLFFEKQLKVAKDGLAEAEVDLKKTQETTGLIKIDEQGRAIISAVASLRAQIAAKEVQLGAMRAFATEKNPDYIVTQQEIVGLKAQLQRLEKASPTSRGDILIPTGKVPEAGLEYVRKLRDVKYYETIFELLARQYEIAKADEARDTSVIQVLDKAVEPERKSKPNRSQIVILTALIVGLLAIIWAFVKEAGEKVRQNPEQAERLNLLRRYVWNK